MGLDPAHRAVRAGDAEFVGDLFLQRRVGGPLGHGRGGRDVVGVGPGDHHLVGDRLVEREAIDRLGLVGIDQGAGDQVPVPDPQARGLRRQAHPPLAGPQGRVDLALGGLVLNHPDPAVLLHPAQASRDDGHLKVVLHTIAIGDLDVLAKHLAGGGHAHELCRVRPQGRDQHLLQRPAHRLGAGHGQPGPEGGAEELRLTRRADRRDQHGQGVQQGEHRRPLDPRSAREVGLKCGDARLEGQVLRAQVVLVRHP